MLKAACKIYIHKNICFDWLLLRGKCIVFFRWEIENKGIFMNLLFGCIVFDS